MRNTLGDLNNHLFAQLERLTEEGLTPNTRQKSSRQTKDGGEGMKAYNPDDFEYSKENTDYIKFKCISCNKLVVLPARFSDGHRCRFCNGYMRPVSYVRRNKSDQS